MASLASKITLRLTGPVTGSKKRYSTAQPDIAFFRDHDLISPRRWFDPCTRLEASRLGGLASHAIVPRGACAKRGAQRDRVVLYLHGGAYVYGPQFWHWVGCASIARRAGVRLEMLHYPRAPESTAGPTVDATIAAYEDLIDRYDPANVTVMGDSAGGGLSAALAIEAARRGLPLPRRLVLLSPWTDLRMTDRAAAEALDPIDPLLALPGIVGCGELYGGGPGSDQAGRDIASPIEGDLSALPETHVFGSSHDLLLPSIREFVLRARAQGAPVHYTEVPGQIHVWPMIPIVPESIATRGDIARLIDSA